jgi:hypothetical protein
VEVLRAEDVPQGGLSKESKTQKTSNENLTEINVFNFCSEHNKHIEIIDKLETVVYYIKQLTCEPWRICLDGGATNFLTSISVDRGVYAKLDAYAAQL